MYLNYWRLREDPFNNALNLRFLHMTPQHGEGVARLLYAAQQQKEGAVLTGEFGTGKSLVRMLFLSKLEAIGNFAVALVENPLAEAEAMMRDIHAQISPKSLPSGLAGGAFRELSLALADRHAHGFHNLVVIEEAQLLSRIESLEQLRILMNLSDGNGRPLLTMIFIGQEDFLRILAQSPGLVQRLPTRWNLAPLTHEQTREYIDHRLSVAGANGWIFEDSAVDALHALSGGTARIINNTADMALYLGMRENAARIDSGIVERIVADQRSSLAPRQAEATP
jgi:general secretion pathway protein A